MGFSRFSARLTRLTALRFDSCTRILHTIAFNSLWKYHSVEIPIEQMPKRKSKQQIITFSQLQNLVGAKYEWPSISKNQQLPVPRFFLLLKNLNFDYFLALKVSLTRSLRSLVRDSALEDKIRIPARPCNILYIFSMLPKIINTQCWIRTISSNFCKNKGRNSTYFAFITFALQYCRTRTDKE